MYDSGCGSNNLITLLPSVNLKHALQSLWETFFMHKENLKKLFRIYDIIAFLKWLDIVIKDVDFEVGMKSTVSSHPALPCMRGRDVRWIQTSNRWGAVDAGCRTGLKPANPSIDPEECWSLSLRLSLSLLSGPYAH